MTLMSSPAASEARSWSFSLSNRAVFIFVSALMFLPSALFAAGLRPVPAFFVLAGCVGGLALIAARPSSAEGGLLNAPADAARLSLCIALACAILVLGGEGHLVYAPLDWRIRDAVLSDLTQGSFPVGYTSAGVDYILRAPLGMYMLPAAVGRVLGLASAHVVMLAQNSLMLGSIFYFLISLGGGWPRLAILVFYSGLSILGAALGFMISKDYTYYRLWWLGLDSWHPMFQYSSSMVQFFWVPNHALPGWWLATLLILKARSEVDLATLGVSLAAAVFWSPLVVIPIAFWLVYLAASDWRSLLASRLWLGALAGACFLPIVLYLVLGSSKIEHGLGFDQPVFMPLYIIFMAAQIPAIRLIFQNREFLQPAMRGLYYFATLSLLALPLFNFGPANDLVMRASIAPLAIVAFMFGGIIQDARVSKRSRHIGLALLLLMTPSALVEFTRDLTYSRYNFSDCSIFEAQHQMGREEFPANYAVESAKIPSWLIDVKGAPLSTARPRECWTEIETLKQVERDFEKIRPRDRKP